MTHTCRASTAFRIFTGMLCICCFSAATLPCRTEAVAFDGPACSPPSWRDIVLIGIGDSLTHGTMDATNNAANSLNAYLQKIFESLNSSVPVTFSQPLLNDDYQRIAPFTIPTNLGIDGSDIFSLEGKIYYKRNGTEESPLSPAYLCNRILPWRLRDVYDKVLYPINLLQHGPVSQLDAAEWLVNQAGSSEASPHVLVILWMGNNDSSTASLGFGGRNPAYIPVPLDLLKDRLDPPLAGLLNSGIKRGTLSCEPYLAEAIEQNLTDAVDFADQYSRVIGRLFESAAAGTKVDIFLCTLPYYSSVGYLFDAHDLEFYLQKANSAYRVPDTFKRSAPVGQPVTAPTSGDRVSLFTFFFMYLLLHDGASVDYVNGVLETDGVQRDGMVLSEDELRCIMARIDSFNDAITAAAREHDGAGVHLVDTGGYLNDLLTGTTVYRVNGTVLSRSWGRGNSFTLDGVHPGYTGHALIANHILTRIHETTGLDAPLHNLDDIIKHDPYADRDGDGWVPGPQHASNGITDILFLLTDPDDSDPGVQPELPEDVWKSVSDRLLGTLR